MKAWIASSYQWSDASQNGHSSYELGGLRKTSHSLRAAPISVIKSERHKQSRTKQNKGAKLYPPTVI